MMLHAWNNYKLYAWGKNELAPLTKQPYSHGVFQNHSFGATIVDALDTLYVMGLKKEFEEGRNWVAQNFSFENIVSKFFYCY